MSGRDAGATYTGTVTSKKTFFIFFNRATALTREPIAQKTQSGVRKTLLGMKNV